MEKKSCAISRQTSITPARRSSPLFYIFLSPHFKKFMCVGLLFFCGVITGVVLNEYLLDGISSRSVVKISERQGDAESDKISHKPKRDEGRPGLSIKKDLSIQFRDYLPRRIFINTALNVPSSLDLFLETYPEACDYHVYTFLADKAYSPLYAKYENHILFSGVIISNSQNITMMDFPASVGEYEGTMMNLPVVQVDVLTWLRDSVHVDDYVVMKLSTDPENEKHIMERLTDSISPDWIDKLYTTTDDDLFYFIREKFQIYGHHVYRWNDIEKTYSDFEVLNPPKASIGDKILIAESCGNENKTHFTPVLYAPHLDFSLNDTLTLLRVMSNKMKGQLPVTLFLPVPYFKSKETCQQLSSLGKNLDFGLFLEESFLRSTEDTSQLIQQHLMRNVLVSVEHCFQHANLTLHFVLPKSAVVEPLEKARKKTKSNNSNKVLKQVLSERFYAVVTRVQDVQPNVITSGERRFIQDVVKPNSNRLIALDVTRPGSDAGVLSLLSTYTSTIVPLNSCAKFREASNQVFPPI